MAEIKIEKRKPIWPWVVVTLIILLLLYFFWYSNRTEVMNHEEIDFQDTLSAQSEVVDEEALSFYRSEPEFFEDYNEYIHFLSDAHASDNDNESDFHRKALLKLIDATREQSVLLDIDVSRNLEEAKENADKVTHDVQNTAGVQVKKAASEITAALKKIQKKNYKSLKSKRENLESAVSDMNGMRAIDDQQEKIFDFHESAKTLLTAMAELEKRNNH